MLAVCCQRHLSPWDGFVDYAMQEVLCLSVFVKYPMYDNVLQYGFAC